MERQGFVNYEKEWWHFSYTVNNPVRFDRVIRWTINLPIRKHHRLNLPSPAGICAGDVASSVVLSTIGLSQPLSAAD